MELQITFSRVRCACGAERQAGRACDLCGCEPEEVDEDLERRRAIIYGVRSRGPIADAEPLALEDACAALGGWLDRFLAAYEASSEGSVAEATWRLRESLTELDALCARVSRSRRLRPSHTVWTAFDGVLAAFGNVRDRYLDALTAETIDEARQAALGGQSALDDVSATLDRFNSLSSAWARVESADLSDELGDVLAGAEAIAALSGTPDMVIIDRQAAELFARITGGAVVMPVGLGLSLQLLDLVVEAAMDPTRFWRTTQAVYEILAMHDATLRRLFADPTWRADLTGVSFETRDAGFEAAAVAAAGANRRRLVQSALRLSARQIERTAPPLLATLLAVERRQAYVSERKHGFNALLTRTAQAGHADLLVGLDPKLRDADAHGAFRIDDDGVRLTGSRGKLDYLSDEELVDAALAGTESITALYWGLVAALVAAGVPVEELDEAVAAPGTDADKIKLILAFHGWRNVDVEIDEAGVVARGNRDGENRPSLIAAVASVVPAGCEALTLIPTTDGASRVATGPLAPLRRWSEAGGLEKEIAFMLAWTTWTIDGSPFLSSAHSEKVYAYRAVEALDPQVPAAVALTTLRLLLNAARALNSSELEAAIAAALRLRRQVATGKPATGVRTIVGAFDQWLLVDLPEFPSSW